MTNVCDKRKLEDIAESIVVVDGEETEFKFRKNELDNGLDKDIDTASSEPLENIYTSEKIMDVRKNYELSTWTKNAEHVMIFSLKTRELIDSFIVDSHNLDKFGHNYAFSGITPMIWMDDGDNQDAKE